MKYYFALPMIFLLSLSSEAMAYDTVYNNNDNYPAVKQDAGTKASPQAVKAEDQDPHKIVYDKDGNVDLDAMPPTAAGPGEQTDSTKP